MNIRFHALPTVQVQAIRNGGLDANGQVAERTTSDGGGNPCRHCLKDIPEGAGMLILAWRPFEALQPYAECGPIFLCSDACECPTDTHTQPEYFALRDQVLLKGYTDQQRIKYGTGQLVPPNRIKQACEAILASPDVAFVDIRSASNNCFQCRVDNS